MRFDLKNHGLHRVLKPWHAEIMRHTWENEEATSLTAYNHLQRLDNPELRKSRSAVIGALNLMVFEGLLGFREEPGKGGYHKLYYPLHENEGVFRHWLAIRVRSAVSFFLEEYEEEE